MCNLFYFSMVAKAEIDVPAARSPVITEKDSEDDILLITCTIIECILNVNCSGNLSFKSTGQHNAKKNILKLRMTRIFGLVIRP